MTPRRLIPKADVDYWELQLRKAVKASLDDMRLSVRATMVRSGLRAPTALVAASQRHKRLVAPPGLGLTVWQAQDWATAVQTNVAPVAASVGALANAQAQNAVPTHLAWGMPTTAPSIANTITGIAIGSGVYLGQRLNANVGQADDPDDAADQVFDTSENIVGGVVGAGAQMGANLSIAAAALYVVSSGLGSTAAANPTQSWNAVDDEATREAHADADGQVVTVGDTFTVDGEDLAFPGDPAGSDENTLNCRCWLEVDGLDSDG